MRQALSASALSAFLASCGYKPFFLLVTVTLVPLRLPLSVGVHAGGLGDTAPLRDLGFDEGGKLRRRVFYGFQAQARKALTNRGLAQDLHDLSVELAHDLLRCAGRGEESHPDAHLEVGYT